MFSFQFFKSFVQCFSISVSQKNIHCCVLTYGTLKLPSTGTPVNFICRRHEQSVISNHRPNDYPRGAHVLPTKFVDKNQKNISRKKTHKVENESTDHISHLHPSQNFIAYTSILPNSISCLGTLLNALGFRPKPEKFSATNQKRALKLLNLVNHSESSITSRKKHLRALGCEPTFRYEHESARNSLS